MTFIIKIYDNHSDWSNKINGSNYSASNFSNFYNDSHIEIDISNVTNFSTDISDYPTNIGKTKFLNLQSLRIIANGNTNVGLTSNINTNDNTGFNSMFKKSETLERIDLSDFRPNKINKRAMANMFYECTNLSDINSEGFQVNEIDENGLSKIFYNCISLINEVNLSNFNPTNVGYNGMYEMFYGCTNLPEVNLSSFNPSTFGSNWSQNMFSNAYSEIQILIHPNWDISSVNSGLNNQATYSSTNWSLDDGTFVNGALSDETRTLEFISISNLINYGNLTLNDVIVSGNIENNGTINGQLTINGNTNTSINGGVFDFDTLTVNKNSGSVIANSDINTDTLVMYSGDILMNNYVLFAGILTHIDGHISGKFKRTLNQLQNVYTFPVGNSNNPHDVDITLKQNQYIDNNSYITVERITEIPNIDSIILLDSGYWQIESNVNSLEYDILLKGKDATEDLSNYKLIHKNSDNTITSINPISIDGTASDFGFLAENVSGFGTFVFGLLDYDTIPHIDIINNNTVIKTLLPNESGDFTLSFTQNEVMSNSPSYGNELNITFDIKNVTDLKIIDNKYYNDSDYNPNDGAFMYSIHKFTLKDDGNLESIKMNGLENLFFSQGLLDNGVSPNLLSVDMSNFGSNLNTLESYATGFMFRNCTNLISVDMTNFGRNLTTSKMYSMRYMFIFCENLTTVNMNNFLSDTTTFQFNGYDMDNMFHGCTSLTELNMLNFMINLTGFLATTITSFPNLNESPNVIVKLPTDTWTISNNNKTASYRLTNWTLTNGTFYVPVVDAYGDPYIQPLHGDVYKLPDKCATYRLIQDTKHNIIINAHVDTIEQKCIDAKVKIIQDKYFNGRTLPNIYNFTQMYFFTKVTIIYKNESWTYNLLEQTSESTPQWLTLSKPIETLYNSKSGIYQNEPMTLTTANIDNILSLNLAWFMNPQINSGISVQTAQFIDGLLMQRYKSESAIVESLDDNTIKTFEVANESDAVYYNETFYPNNKDTYVRKIAVL